MEFQIQMSNAGCFLRLSPTHRLTNKDVPRDRLPWPWELGPTWNGAKCHHGLSLSPFHLSTRRYTSWMSQPSLRFKPGIHIKLLKAGLNRNEDTPNVYLTTEISSTSVKVRFTLATNWKQKRKWKQRSKSLCQSKNKERPDENWKFYQQGRRM